MIYRMWHKKYNEYVSVYFIDYEYALIYSNFLESKNNNGWSKCKLSNLTPLEDFKTSTAVSDEHSTGFINNIADLVITTASGEQ